MDLDLTGKIAEGSKVWVVYGRKLANGHEATVTQVARKYGYLEVSGTLQVIRFELATGLSTHGSKDNDFSAHRNERGYEVFLSHDDAENIYRERVSRTLLRSRLAGSLWTAASAMPIEMVERWLADIKFLDKQARSRDK